MVFDLGPTGANSLGGPYMETEDPVTVGLPSSVCVLPESERLWSPAESLLKHDRHEPDTNVPGIAWSRRDLSVRALQG